MFAESSLLKGVSAGHNNSTVMVTVQDLINCAMGPPEGNKVNFKLIRKILHILARQMRIQEQFVDFGYEESSSKISAESNKQNTGNYGQNLQAKGKYIADIDNQRKEHKKEREKANDDTKIEKKEESNAKKKEIELATDKERAEYERQKAKEHMAGTQQAKLAKMTDKERSEDKNHESKEPDIKENEKAKITNIPDKETAEYERQGTKERNIEDKENSKLAKISNKERAEYESKNKKERDNEENKNVIIAKTPKTERTEYESQNAKDQYIEEKAILAKMTVIERAEYERQKAKERYIEENKIVKSSKITEKERAEYESQKAKERDIGEKQTAKLPKIMEKESAEYESQKAKERDIGEKETAKLPKITKKESVEYESQNAKERDIGDKGTAKLHKTTEKESSEYESQMAKERDIGEKETAILPKIMEKESAEYERQKAKERDIGENNTAKSHKITEKESSEYESQKAKERDIGEKETAKLPKITEKESAEYESQNAKERDIGEKETAESYKITEKESAEYESQKAKQRDSKEKEKAKLAKMADKERAEYESQKAKGRDIEEKENNKSPKITENESAEYENEKAKERHIEERNKSKIAKMTENERAEHEGQNAKEQDMEEKAELEKLTTKVILTNEERAKYESEKTKEQDIEEKEKIESKSQKAKQRDIDEKDETKLVNTTDSERAEYENQKAKERDIQYEPKSAHMSDKEGTEYESQKSKEQDSREKENVKLAKIIDKERTDYEIQKAKERDIEEIEMAKLAKSTDKERAQYESHKAKEWDVGEKVKLFDKEIAKYEVQKVKERVMEERKLANVGESSDKVKAEYESYKEKERAMEETQKKMKAKISDQKKMRGTSVKDSQHRVGSMEVVTRSEFDLLEGRVEDLEERVAPISYPLLPLKFNLKKELSVSRLSLTDSMQALQMMARVQAAEEAVTRMADALTMLLVESEVSKEVAGKMESATVGIRGAYDESTEVEPILDGREARKVVDSKNVQIGSRSWSSGLQGYQTGSNVQEDSQFQLPITQQTEGEEHRISLKLVTHADLDYAVGVLQDEMIKKANAMTSMTNITAEIAHNTVQTLVDRTTKLSDIDIRMNKLHLLVDDYAQQLASFDTPGIETQLNNFYAQLKAARSELETGVTIFETSLNKETEDVKYLKSRYDELVAVLGMTSWSHKQLTTYQTELADELRRQLEFVEKLQEDKVDSDMLLDGLRDKADRSDLIGLLYDAEFNISRAAMERKLLRLQEKFDLQDNAWMHAIKELTDAARLKADIRMLLTYKAEAEEQLIQIQQGLNIVAKAIGGPKATLLIRQLKQAGLCGACSTNAVPVPVEQMPPRLPVFRRHFPTTEAVCETRVPGPPPPPPLDDRQHVCRRWVGGSHTLLSDKVVRTEAPKLVHHPIKKYTGVGDDGRLYKMDKLLPPCSECIQPEDVAGILVDEAGDTGMAKKSGRHA